MRRLCRWKVSGLVSGFAACNLALMPAILPAGAAGLRANGIAPAIVAQDAPGRPEIETTLRGITLPPGFHIALFALVPDARDLAVSADGRKVFVGTMERDIYVADVGPGHTAASVKRFAPGIHG